MITCEEFAENVSDYLDDRVPFGKKIGMCMHRLICVKCRTYYRQLKDVVEFVEEHGEAPDLAPSPDQRDALLEKYRRRHGSDD